MIQDFFSYNGLEGLLTYKIDDSKFTIHLKNISTAVYFKKFERVICLCTEAGKVHLYGYDAVGNKLFNVAPPKYHDFWYLSTTAMKVACQVNTEKAESSGRSGWWFLIDPDTGDFTKDTWVY